METQIGNIRQKKVEPVDESIRVTVTTSAQDKLQIYRLRYQVYIEEMGRKLSGADHENGLLYDELDDWSYLVSAKIGAKVIGSVRLNIGRAENFPENLVSTLLMNKFQTFGNGQHNLCFASKYIVSPAYRTTRAGGLLLGCLDDICRQHQVQINLAGCNPHLITFYEKVGYRRFTDSFNVPEYGRMVPLAWIVEDIDHLRAVRSPYLRNAYKWDNRITAANWFSREFPESSEFVNSRLVNEDEVWALLRQKLGQSPEQAIPALSGLTEDEARKLAHLGVVHRFKKGDRLISAGDRSHEMNILLNGRLNASIPSSVLAKEIELTAGHIFGEVALSVPKEQTVDITSGTDGEYLIMPETSFRKYRCNYPIAADKILQNINQLKSYTV